MRWKVFYYLNLVMVGEKEIFRFKIKNCLFVVEEMKRFEKGMIRII